MSDIRPGILVYEALVFKGLKRPHEELSDKEFSHCSFQDCDFTGTVFESCQFANSEFINCNLSVMVLTNSVFNTVSFTDCKILGVNWTQARRASLNAGSPYRFQNCILNDSSFLGLNLSELRLLSCPAYDVDFREANLKHADCQGTDFTNSLFMHTCLDGANFVGASNYNIDVRHNHLLGAKFDRYESIRLLQCLEIEIVD